MFGLSRVAIIAGLVALAVAALVYQSKRIEALRLDLAECQQQADAAQGVIRDLIRDRSRDNAVDEIPPGDLVDFGRRWLRESAGPSD